MLVISRSILESVLVYAPSGEVIEFTLLGVTNGQVKLGLTAPRDWPILRAELTFYLPFNNHPPITHGTGRSFGQS
ncbi:MAG: carbon storage regulator [Planctomycetota bacterium]|nr:carbon storage regulator [Planctomycetota bacterium]